MASLPPVGTEADWRELGKIPTWQRLFFPLDSAPVLHPGVFCEPSGESMPQHAPDRARIVRVRRPADLLQRLDRVLDGQATARQRPATRHTTIRAAWRAWRDDSEPR